MQERVILNNLMHNEQFSRQVTPFLKDEYFTDHNEKTIFKIIDNFIRKYNERPNEQAIMIELGKVEDLSDDQLKDCEQIVKSISIEPQNVQYDWLLETTEEFCKEKALYNALAQSIKIAEGKHGKLTKGAIPQLLQDALGVSFDTSLGHDYVEDAEARFDYYAENLKRVSTNLYYLNQITKGGFPIKTLNVIVAGTNVGKSLWMCHLAAHNLLDGKNVLYFTMEMSQEEISRRIDANCLDISLEDFDTLPKDVFKKRMAKLKKHGLGKIIVKEYPTGSASVTHFRSFINELKLKKKFIPDIIYIDYLTICASARVSMEKTGPYTLYKMVAEELRGLGVECVVPVVTGAQLNRSGFKSSDVDMDDTAESFGLPFTADFMLAVMTNEELEALGQYLCKQVKSRYGDKKKLRRFVVGVDTVKQRLYDVEQVAQIEKEEDTPVMDNTEFGEQIKERESRFKEFNFSE